MSRKGHVHVDEEPEDTKNRTVVFCFKKQRCWNKLNREMMKNEYKIRGRV
jgi:hypothetical protein